jgi:hypothetical protein
MRKAMTNDVIAAANSLAIDQPKCG